VIRPVAIASGLIVIAIGMIATATGMISIAIGQKPTLLGFHGIPNRQLCFRVNKIAATYGRKKPPIGSATNSRASQTSDQETKRTVVPFIPDCALDGLCANAQCVRICAIPIVIGMGYPAGSPAQLAF